jgi:predicted P-loop ATPase
LAREREKRLGAHNQPIHPAKQSSPDTGRPKAACLTEQINRHLCTEYDFRYNVLTEETEFRKSAATPGTPFRPVGKRELNTICMEAHAHGIACWDRDVNRFIYSTRITPYHPFGLYMDELPAWDGTDRLTPLARRVSDAPLWLAGFHHWMLGLTAQWQGTTSLHANSVAPILVSREQGRQKSTFCRLLMPHTLERYYMDNLKLSSDGQSERMLAEMGLINLDEFDKYAENKMPMLKNLMQMSKLHIRRAYQANYRNLPRIASFIGTSNRFDLLTDPTGSRRFLCVEVNHTIDCSDIVHKQLFAQLKHELAAGARSWFTKDEECALQQHNARFYRIQPAEEVFRTYFRAAADDEEALDLTSAAIFKELQQRNPAALRGYNPIRIGQILTRAGIRRKHTEFGNVYEVVRR